MPPMPMPPVMPMMPEAVVMPEAQTSEPEPAEKPKKRGKWLKRIFFLLVISIAGAGGADYGGFVDLTEYLPILEDYLP